jgi:putative glycerol-1-phosphate prenyltransferase
LIKDKTTPAKPVTTWQHIIRIKDSLGAGYFVLIDPDKWNDEELVDFAMAAEEGGADAILIGGSLLLSSSFDEIVRRVKKNVRIPVIIFPGSPTQVSRYADALFFLSLISGRNPTYLIGEQVKAAPVLKTLGTEAISVGYMLVESGRITSTEFMSNTQPIPNDKPDIAKATALAAQYLGMQMVYLEAGSGAKQAVPDQMISSVRDYVSLPIIVGGGIRTPEEARKKVKAGASFVVTGNVLERSIDVRIIQEFAEAVHTRILK